jgi:hypothetical protein
MPPSVDKEWVESLIGLRMKVEECWWEGFSGTALCPGQIVVASSSNLMEMNGSIL